MGRRESGVGGSRSGSSTGPPSPLETGCMGPRWPPAAEASPGRSDVEVSEGFPPGPFPTGSIPEVWDPQALAGETQGSWQRLVTSAFHTTDFSRSLATKGPRSRRRESGQAGASGRGPLRSPFLRANSGPGPDASCCPVSVLVFGFGFFGFCVGGWGSRGRWPCVLTGRTGPAAHTRPASRAML